MTEAKVIRVDRGEALLRLIRPLAAIYSGSTAFFVVLSLYAFGAFIIAFFSGDVETPALFFGALGVATWVPLHMLGTWVPKRLTGFAAVVWGLFLLASNFAIGLHGLVTLAGRPTPGLRYSFPELCGSTIVAFGLIGMAIGARIAWAGVRLMFARGDTLKMAFLPMPSFFRPDNALLYLLGADPRIYLGTGAPLRYAASILICRTLSAFGIVLAGSPFFTYNAWLRAVQTNGCEPRQLQGVPVVEVYCSIVKFNPLLEIGDAIVVLLLISAVVGLIILVASSSASIFLDRLAVVDMQSRLSKDKRSPTLFLRSFGDDRIELKRSKLVQILSFRRKPTTADELMESIFGGFGPYIAIGRPGERQRTFGASRVYLGDDEWQSEVTQFIHEARFVVVFLDKSEGLKWEIDQVLSQGALNKTLFILPPDANLFETVELLSGFPALASYFSLEEKATRAVALLHIENKPIVFASNARGADAYQCVCNYVCKFALKDRWLDRNS